MKSVKSQAVRAPTHTDQVAFFRKVRSQVRLSPSDDFQYSVAFAYNSIDAGDNEAVSEAETHLRRMLETTKSWRSRWPKAPISPKRGHHFFYSVASALSHVLLWQNTPREFDDLVDEVAKFFEQTTTRLKDKGFGWAIVNAVNVVGLGALRSRILHDDERSEQRLQLMDHMLRLAVSGRTGPLEWPQIYHTCVRAYLIKEWSASPDMSEPRYVFNRLTRYRTDAAESRAFNSLTSSSQS